MQELIDKLIADAGITAEQAQKSVDVIKNFVKEKFPMLGGAVDNMLGASISSADDGLDG
jgi:polyhydroxyalkanoate synthesis regulator phasin